MAPKEQNKTEGHLIYEPEADVLSWEITRETPIESAREIGNVIIHFTKQNVPVLIEILDATHFLHQADKAFNQARRGALRPEAAGA